MCHLRSTESGLLIIWDWDAGHVTADDEQVDDSDDETVYSGEDDQSGSGSDTEDDNETTVAFKCIRVTQDAVYQSILAEVKERLKREKVAVKMSPEPTNQFDARAIAFQCHHRGTWQTIGYVVREALDDVHEAIETCKIVSVEFAWVKYKLLKRSPGYYTAILITRKGDWSRTVKRCCSSFY